ncbi:uncharacterized protein OCT59_012436 [Rhizophagus irregularis]|nr:hypothetical protein OCT59_012436 [Rhizophagus irregularis]
MLVILRILNDPASITLKLINKIAVSIAVSYEVYGITQDPETKNYMLSAHSDIGEALEWIPYDRFRDIKCIAKGGFGKVYKAKWFDGNIYEWNDYKQNWKRNQNMVVALKSLNNSRNVTLEFMNEITLHHKVMICLDANQSNRPNAAEIKKTLNQWLSESQGLIVYDISSSNNYTSMRKQIMEVDEINKSSSNSSITSTNLGTSYVTHSEAVYTSRLLDFSNLPEPKNSDDYYEENGNIISMKFSESLQIDISQLKISNSFELKNSDDNYEKNDNIKMKPSESLQIDILQSPEPDNSDDSYEKNDNIISMNSSAESLQIDIYQLNTSKDDQDRKSKGKEKI